MSGYNFTKSLPSHEDTVEVGRYRPNGSKTAQTNTKENILSNGTKNTDNDDNSIHSSQASSNLALKRNVGFVSGSSLIIGSVIGSGIFLSPAGVLSGSGSVALSLIIWAVCGFIATLGALCYAELGTLIQKSGGEYIYFKEGFSNVWGFLFVWVNVIVTRPASQAIIAMTCGEYMLAMFFDSNCGPPPRMLLKLFSAFVVLLLGALNMWSVKAASNVNVIFTFAKCAALLIVIIGGVVKLFQGNTEILATGFEGTESDIGLVALGFYSGMWSYDGWNSLNVVIDEMQDVPRNLPRSIIFSVPFVTLVYILTNIAYFTVLTPQEILDSSAVAVSWSDKVMPSFTWFISLSVGLSTFGAINAALFTSGRVCFAAAKDGNFPSILSMVHVKRFTPGTAIFFSTVLTIIFIIPSDVDSLLDLFSFVAWTIYGGVMVALLVLRYRMKDDPRPFKVPIICPILVLLVSIYLVIGPLVAYPAIEYLFAVVFIVVGFFVYLPLIWFNKIPPFMDSVTTFCQLFFQSSPPEDY